MKLGEKIRLLRKRRGITLKDISEKTGFSTSYISQVERDIVNPSVDSLKRICDSLDVPLASFFDDEKFEAITNSNIVRKNCRKTLNSNESKVQMFLLSPNLDRKIELILIVAQPGGKSGNSRHIHAGEECGMVIKGKMDLQIEDKIYTLDEGDSMYFSSDQEHRWWNNGEEECVSIWAITPPSF